MELSILLGCFSNPRRLAVSNFRFLQPTRTDSNSVVEIVAPADLLKADTYYTVHLRLAVRTDHFTFKVVDRK